MPQELRFWQVSAIKTLGDWSCADDLRPCELPDEVGLGKTWVMVC